MTIALPIPQIYAIVVQSEPVPKARPRMARGRVFTPRTTEKAEWEIRETWCRDVGGSPLEGPLALQVTVYVPQPASIPKKRRLIALPTKRPDADNYAKTVLDALNHVAYADDAQVVDLNVRKRYAVDSPPRWEISVEELREDHAAS